MAPGLQVFRALVLIRNNVDIYNEMHKFNILPQKYSFATDTMLMVPFIYYINKTRLMYKLKFSAK